ncbi:glycosyltransferase 87 family protein [Hymenobacter sp. 15J16-1T3B]|uniref:glycosyltransferase 87 family protein n=1 Tax=Hymenobacter sp. 15J16-1T3B TaxID=2886941 RepID=UPI001D11AE96|nr:glycosyltransferase 87 family protein [Hymenobacter sp. 15J16-1T3B]
MVLLPATGFKNDFWLWVRWAQYSRAHGLGNVYAVPGNNYNPLYHYMLWLFGQLAGSSAAIETQRYSLKLLTLPFDVAGALLAASLAGGGRRRFLSSLGLLLNLGYLYNSLVWGQVDAIYSCLSLAAVVLALRGRGAWSAACFALALAAKLQALIFLPPLLLLWAPRWWQAPRRLAAALLAGAGTLALVLLPFAVGGERSYLADIWRINRQAVGYYPFLSMNAFNWWQLTADGPLLTRLDSDLWHGLSYQRWGLLLFGVAATAVLLPLLLHALSRLRQPRPPDRPLALLSFALVPLVFCFFNTQMHERYWHPAVLFLGAYAGVSRRYALLVLVSLAYLLNLDAVLGYLPLRAWSPGLLHPKVVALLFAAAIGVGLTELYRLAPLGTGLRALGRQRATARLA